MGEHAPDPHTPLRPVRHHPSDRQRAHGRRRCPRRARGRGRAGWQARHDRRDDGSIPRGSSTISVVPWSSPMADRCGNPEPSGQRPAAHGGCARRRHQGDRTLLCRPGAVGGLGARRRCHRDLPGRTLEAARRAADAGVDVITAQGTEAGGHTGHVSTLTLVPAVVDAVVSLMSPRASSCLSISIRRPVSGAPQ